MLAHFILNIHFSRLKTLTVILLVNFGGKALDLHIIKKFIMWYLLFYFKLGVTGIKQCRYGSF